MQIDSLYMLHVGPLKTVFEMAKKKKKNDVFVIRKMMLGEKLFDWCWKKCSKPFRVVNHAKL